MKRLKIVHLLACMALLSCGSSFAAFDAKAVLSDIEQVSGIDIAAQHDKLLGGQLVTSSDGRFEAAKAEIAAAQMMYLPVKVSDMAAFLSTAKFHSQAKKVQALTSADTAVTIVTLDDKDAKNIANASPGGDFNFSAAEYKELASGSDVSTTLNAILSARHAAYARSGLDGIADYQVGKNQTVNIAHYLEETEKSAKVLKKDFPALYAAALGYPKAGASLDNKLFAVALEVEGEPQFVLSHWMIDKDSGDYVAGMQRQYYVNHTYDTLQMSFVVLPYADGVLVVLLNQTFTPKVTGFASGMAHNIGRKRLAEAIAETFTLVKGAVK